MENKRSLATALIEVRAQFQCLNIEVPPAEFRLGSLNEAIKIANQTTGYAGDLLQHVQLRDGTFRLVGFDFTFPRVDFPPGHRHVGFFKVPTRWNGGDFR